VGAPSVWHRARSLSTRTRGPYSVRPCSAAGKRSLFFTLPARGCPHPDLRWNCPWAWPGVRAGNKERDAALPCGDAWERFLDRCGELHRRLDASTPEKRQLALRAADAANPNDALRTNVRLRRGSSGYDLARPMTTRLLRYDLARPMTTRLVRLRRGSSVTTRFAEASSSVTESANV
jgi:hypothetical protein